MKRALIACVAAFALVHAVVALWTPVQGDAWLHWVWAGRHPDGGVGTWLLAHHTFAEAVGYVLARVAWVHIVVSPLVAVALVVGTCTIALRRLPRATGDDLLALGLVSALIWIAQPHAGMAWFYIPSVATHVYGAAIAVWLVAAARCGWIVPWPLVIVASYCVGTSTRAIALVTLVAVFVLVRRQRNMRVLLGALLVATVYGFARAPLLEIGKILRRGLDPNLFVLKLPIEAIGKVVSLVAAFALVELGRRVFGRLVAGDDDAQPDPRASAWLVVAYLATSVFCLFGPHYYEATLLPATLVLVVAAVPWLLWFARQRGYRITLIAFVVAVQVIAWATSLATYHWIGEEGARRMELIAAAKPGDVVTVPPYSDILATNWFFGEDFSTARMRQLVAVEAFGLRGIEILPEFRRLEENPHIMVELQVDGATPAQLAEASPPKIWSTVPSVAREQFDQFVHKLEPGADARLVVTNVAFLDAKARPLVLAWLHGSELVSPRVVASTLDEENRYTVKMYTDLGRFNEAWWIQAGVATKTPYRNGSPRMRPTLPVLSAIVVCNADRCLLADALVPRF
ncbi:MAG: hypothetical protein ABJE66_05095 [Deltaproteobacteria bacterium]